MEALAGGKELIFVVYQSCRFRLKYAKGNVMKRQIASLILVSMWATAAQAAGQIKLNVSLNPVGSFAAESKALQGTATQDGPLISIKNATLELDTLKSGIALRDSHMKEKYFETKKFPRALLSQATGKDKKFNGDLTLRNKTKKISGSYEVTGGNVIAKFKCNLSDFDIPPANYMGVGVEDEVEVEAQVPMAAKAVK